jgi:hypothetical protein
MEFLEFLSRTPSSPQAGEKEMFEEAEKERQAAEREAMAAAAAEDEEGGEEEDHDEF